MLMVYCEALANDSVVKFVEVDGAVGRALSDVIEHMTAY
jgi:hypothetical protein